MKSATAIAAMMMGMFGRRGTPSMNAPPERVRGLGNRGKPREVQLEILKAAKAKAERKLARPGGWYSGD